MGIYSFLPRPTSVTCPFGSLSFKISFNFSDFFTVIFHRHLSVILFTISHSVHTSLAQCMLGYTTPPRWADTPPGQTPPWADYPPPPSSGQTPIPPPPATATAAQGTHPTGMHPCFQGKRARKSCSSVPYQHTLYVQLTKEVVEDEYICFRCPHSWQLGTHAHFCTHQGGCRRRIFALDTHTAGSWVFSGTVSRLTWYATG